VPTPEVLRRSGLAAVTVTVVVGLLVGAAASDAFWVAWGLSWIGFPLVGALILWQRPGHAIGWLLMATGACWAILLVGYGLMGEMSVWLELVVVLAGRLGYTTLIAIVVLFPSGRAKTPGTRLLLWATAVAASCVVVAGLVDPLPLQISQKPNPLAVPALSGVVGWFNNQGFMIVPLLMLGALVSLVARWRRSSGSERLQYRWFALAVGLAVIMLVTTSTLFNTMDVPKIVFAIATAIGLNAVPVAIGVAVTRYRLYEFDRVVSRTISYGLVTVGLLAVYAALVAAASTLFPESSDLAVAAATLAAAALFRPLLRRCQRVVDRRFNRDRYDALATVDQFAGRLRHEVDPSLVSGELLSVLSRTVQPTSAALWLREPAS